ncbi:MAG TPA: SBBP repeat-containing protein, partial [Pyrinomonadaceae bacterium]|nr:SBBP repeat-containing protein [Pyrinomonadaceae bacterium]
MNLHIPPSSRIGRIVLLLAVACLLAVFASVIFVGAQNADNNFPTANTAAPTRARVAESFGRLPLSFELNKGQIDKQVKFLSHGPGYDLFLTSTEAVLRVQKPTVLQVEKSRDQDVREGTVLRLKMLGASARPQVEGQEELPGKIHYFIGNDPAKWRRNIPTYRKAYFKDIYPGIDVVYYGTQRELEYDFVIGPGANPKLIRFSVEGADKIRLDKFGKLLLTLKHGEVSLNKPVIYQLDKNGSRREVKGMYVVNGNEVRFKLDRFDSGKALIIDPVLSYSTLLGSFNSDGANGIAVDSQGSAYITGTAELSGFPTTPGAFQTTSPRGGAFITKLDPTGSSLVYSTYLSGENNSSRGNGIAVDATGNAYVTGISDGNNFPSVNPLKTTSTFFTTSDAAANWNNLNKGLVGDIQSLAVAPTAPNTIYAPTTDGFYRSTDGGANWSKTPSQGSSSPSFNGANGIAVDPTNSATVYVAFFSSLMKTTDGGNTWTGVNTSPVGFFNIFTIVIDPVTPSTIYVGAGNGVFKSTDSGANWIVQNNFGVPSTPIVRTLAIDPTTPLTIYAGTNGNGLFKSTNGGAVWTAMNTGMTGPGVSNVGSIAIDPANPQTIYTGTSLPGTIFKSTNGAASWDPLTNGVPSVGISAIVVNSSGVFASVSGNGVIKSTNGGANWTSASNGLWNSVVRFLVAHPSNTSVLYAATNSSFSADAFVTKLNASGSGLLFSTLLGGNDGETGNGIALDANGNVVIVGSTGSLNFPTVNAVQGSPPSDRHNGFVTKLNPSVPSIVFSTYLRGSSADIALGVAIDSSSNVYVTGLTNSSDFLIANAFQPTFSGGFNGDAFVTKLTSAGALTYSTFLGGNGTENGEAIAADNFGNAYVTGFTDSTNFPTKNP